MRIITSRDNQKLKSARNVRDCKIKDQIFIEGLRLAEEVFRSKITITEAFATEDFTANNVEFVDKLSSRTQLFTVSDKLLNSISDTKNPQGIILICKKPDFEDKFFQSKNDFPIILLLHKINNPNNLGAVLRTAEAVGIQKVIISKNSANAFSPKSLRASMGSLLRIYIWENVKFEAALKWAEENDLITTCADINADKSYTEIDWKKPRLLIFGSEAHGFSTKELTRIKEKSFIQMENNVESLNLAVACGVILFEAKRQFSN